MWTPDVYEGAPTSITAFFAIVPKVSAVALIYRFCLEPFGNFYSEWASDYYFFIYCFNVSWSDCCHISIKY